MKTPRNLIKNTHKIGFLMLLTIYIFIIIQASNYSYNLNLNMNSFQNIPFQKGMSYTRWDGEYNSSLTYQQLDELKEMGVEWLAINAWAWQDYLNSTTITMGGGNNTYNHLIDLFKYARSIGLHILYKPMLNLAKVYDWRSYIIFTPEWMGNYTEWMVQNARIAQEGGVEILSIGCEMGNMQIHSEEVRQMINSIRNVYDGLLTYSANHDSFKYIDWYDAIDIIGISMYSMMTITMNPSVDELTTVWNSMYSDLSELSYKWKKPILFTETGIQALDGSNMIPNDNQLSDKCDISEMENYYKSLFNSKIWSAYWFKGAYWWIWDETASSSMESNSQCGFNPKLIKNIIKDEYKSTRVEASILNVLLKIWIPILIAPLSALIFYMTYVKDKKRFSKDVIEDKIIGKDDININVNADSKEAINTSILLDNSKKKENYKSKSVNLVSENYLANIVNLGLFIGIILFHTLISLTLDIHGLIQRMFSFSIILNLSISFFIEVSLFFFIISLIIGVFLISSSNHKKIEYSFLFSIFVLLNTLLYFEDILLSNNKYIWFLKIGVDIIFVSIGLALIISYINEKFPVSFFQFQTDSQQDTTNSSFQNNNNSLKNVPFQDQDQDQILSNKTKSIKKTVVLKIITISLSEVLILICLGLIFEEIVNLLLFIPISYIFFSEMIMKLRNDSIIAHIGKIYHKNVQMKREDESKSGEKELLNNNKNIIINTSKKRLTPLKIITFWLLSLCFGIFFTFENSHLNLVNMEQTTISYYYIPGMLVISTILLFYFIFQANSNKKTKKSSDSSSSMKIKRIKVITPITKSVNINFGILLKILFFSLIMAIINTLFFNNSILFWSVISGFLLFIYLQTLTEIFLLVEESSNSTVDKSVKKKTNIKQKSLYRKFFAILGSLYSLSLGIIINGVKGLFIYLVTFLKFDNGKIERRDPSTDPVGNLNVELLLNSVILLIGFLFWLISLIFYYIEYKSSNKNN